jgi:hypothetical protein
MFELSTSLTKAWPMHTERQRSYDDTLDTSDNTTFFLLLVVC